MQLKESKRSLFEKAPIQHVRLCKLYHVYKRRNEWADWSGYTQLVSRSGKHLKLTLDEAESHAENQRNQGTKFFIDETPALLCTNQYGAVVITELFSNNPLKALCDALPNLNELVHTPYDLVNHIPKGQWISAEIYDVKTSFQTYDTNTFFKRTSSPGQYLCWSLKMANTEKKYIETIITNLQQHVAA